MYEVTDSCICVISKVWFDLAKTREGEQGRTKLEKQVDTGALKATVRIKDRSGTAYSIRMNL